MKTNLSFGRFLSSHRVGAGKKQDRVARELGVGISTVSGWELNKAFPVADRLPGISIVYQIPMEMLKQQYASSVEKSREEKATAHSIRWGKKKKQKKSMHDNAALDEEMFPGYIEPVWERIRISRPCRDKN